MKPFKNICFNQEFIQKNNIKLSAEELIIFYGVVETVINTKTMKTKKDDNDNVLYKLDKELLLERLPCLSFASVTTLRKKINDLERWGFIYNSRGYLGFLKQGIEYIKDSSFFDIDIKELNKVKKVPDDSKSENKLDKKSFEYELSKKFYEANKNKGALKNQIKKKGEKHILKDWIETLVYLQTTKNYKKNELKKIINFIRVDNFWQNQVFSLNKLKKKQKKTGKLYAKIFLEKYNKKIDGKETQRKNGYGYTQKEVETLQKCFKQFGKRYPKMKEFLKEKEKEIKIKNAFGQVMILHSDGVEDFNNTTKELLKGLRKYKVWLLLNAKQQKKDGEWCIKHPENWIKEQYWKKEKFDIDLKDKYNQKKLKKTLNKIIERDGGSSKFKKVWGKEIYKIINN